MICQKCGTTNPDQSESCINCGTPLMQNSYETSGIMPNNNQATPNTIKPINDYGQTTAAPIKSKREDIRPFSELIKDSFEVLKKNWLNYSFILLISTIVGEIFSLTFQGKDNYFLGEGIGTGAVNIFSPLGIIIFVLFILFSSFITLSLLRSVFMAAENNIENITDSLKYSAKNFLPYLLVTIIFVFGVSLGYMALIIPGIIISLMWSMISPVFIIEGERGINVFQKSKELVRGYMLKIFLKIFLLILVFFIAVISFSVVTSFVVSLFFAAGFISYLLGIVLMFVVYLIGGVTSSSFTYFIYKDLKEIKAQ